MKHWQFLPVLVLVTIFTGCRDKKLESAQAKTTRPDSMESRNGTKEEQTGGAHRGGASASRPGKESHPVDLAAGDQHLRELIRKTEDAEKNDTYDSSDGKKKMDAGFAVSLDERVLAEMKAVLPDEPPLEVFGVTGAIAPAFIKRMTLYPRSPCHAEYLSGRIAESPCGWNHRDSLKPTGQILRSHWPHSRSQQFESGIGHSHECRRLIHGQQRPVPQERLQHRPQTHDARDRDSDEAVFRQS